MTIPTETADQRTARIVAKVADHDPTIASWIERVFPPEGAGEPTCSLGEMHGRASTFMDAAGRRCCDFCGQPVSAEPAVDPLVEVLAREIHTYLCRRDVMQYLDNEEDCHGLACWLASRLPDMIRAAPECIPADVKRGIVEARCEAAEKARPGRHLRLGKDWDDGFDHALRLIQEARP